MKLLSDSDIDQLAQLSQLHLTTTEKEHFKQDLTQIIQYIERIQQVPVKDVSAMAHTHDIQLPLRDDTAQEPSLGTRCVSGSAGYDDGLVKVPGILPAKQS